MSILKSGIGQIKIEELPSCTIFITNLQHVSTQIGPHHVVLEEYRNSDRVHMKYEESTKYLFVTIGSDHN
jgi:hypothetical protein